MLDIDGSVVDPFVDKDGDILYGIDSEFGFEVTDFIGAEDKELDGDYAEGFAGDIIDDAADILGLAVRNSPTDVFRSGAPLGTWSLGLGGQTVKASTEHYATIASVLSDQKYPGDPDAIGALDNDLKFLDLRPSSVDGVFEAGLLHELYAEEVTQALQLAMDNTLNDQTYNDIDFDRDGTLDTYATVGTFVDADVDDDGTVETVLVGGVDLDADGTADVVDSFLNGFGGTADIIDLLEPNESSITYDIAYSTDYSVTVKDDGKLLYRWGEAVKRPNDIRLEVDIELPAEWTEDLDDNGIADVLENGFEGFDVTKAELRITHNITNNPNDQVRPEDYENEAAIGRLPSHYIVKDPDDPTNTLWISPVDSYNGEGTFLPSYLKLDAAGQVDLTAGGIEVFDLDDNLVGYRNEDEAGAPIGTVLRDLSLVALADAADLTFTTSDLAQGFTAEWYTTVDREPFEWSYDKFPDDPYRNVFESFRDPDLAEAAGYSEDDLVSGPRWRLTPNKFGQDLPGLEVPLVPNTSPPYQKDNIKYETGELVTTTLNLLDWDEESPLSNSLGWMTVDKGRLDENSDGLIDEGWSQVNGTLGAGDDLPEGFVLTAVTPNGVTLDANFFDTSIYVKGDRQDAAKLYDMELIIEYDSNEPVIGSVQKIEGLTHTAETVAFEGAATFLNPVVFASPVSTNGGEPVTVEFSEITATGATFYLEEPDYTDGTHTPEDVTLLTFEEGIWDLSDGSLLQVGTTEFAGGALNDFQSVEFDVTFDETPILLLQIQTNNGPDWEIARARNVSTTGFEYAIQEVEAAPVDFHLGEVVGWAAFDASAADGSFDWSGIAAQAFSTGETVTSAPTPFAFEDDLGTDPLVSAILSSFNGDNTANLRLANLVDDGEAATAVFVAAEETSQDQEVMHVAEDVTGLAFAEEGVLTGLAYVEDTFLFV
ncbi:hypothetical protein [uncultured Tateyamaria sp.]|uniref:hypothetical protein n=1 Tax=uncultured Tateyamaria sp. TaxID=455651 RepID=UPI002614AACB|nr:hypothetical protein [uncultured Tateyamaria sp.]